MAKAEGEKVKRAKKEAADSKPKARPSQAGGKEAKKTSAKADSGAKAEKKAVKKTTGKATAKESKKGAKKATEKKASAKAKSTTRKTAAVKAEIAPTAFNKPGQRHVTPPKVGHATHLAFIAAQGDGTRGFYESLYEANPHSVVAIVYCVEHGLFGGHKHQQLLERYQELRKQGFLKGGSGGIRPSAVQFLQKFKPKAAK